MKGATYASHRQILWDPDQNVFQGARCSSFHAIYGEFNGVFDVKTLEMIEGDLPQRAQRLVLDWAERYKGELEQMWKTQDYKTLPGLE